jgi:hypothetical protein
VPPGLSQADDAHDDIQVVGQVALQILLEGELRAMSREVLKG